MPLEATLKPIHFQFMPKTVTHVLVAQACWDTAPNTWPGNCKAPVAKYVVPCVVCLAGQNTGDQTKYKPHK